MIKKWTACSMLLLAFGFICLSISGQGKDDPGKTRKVEDKLEAKSPEKSEKKAEAEKPKTAKVEKGTLTEVIYLKGNIEAAPGQEINLKPKVWSGSLQVKKVIEHGTTVKAGDVLLEFDTEKIDLAIKELKQDRESAEITLKIAELELPLSEKQYAMDLTTATREAKNSEDDAKKYAEVDKPLQLEAAEQNLKSTAFFLETAKDELKQLSKMYKDKDLTEETEEIVLKRYKNSVEQAEFTYKASKVRYDQLTKIDIPRREIAITESVSKSKIGLTRIKDIQALSMQQKKLGLQKFQYDDTKAKERLADMEKDRESMTVKAAKDGIVYYGQCVRGNWSGQNGLFVGGNVMPSNVVMTVVSVDKLYFRGDASEAEAAKLNLGIGGRVTPNSNPTSKLDGKLTKVGNAPQNGRYDIQAELKGDISKLVPGMTATLRLTPTKLIDVPTLPSAVVMTDEDDDETKYVYLPTSDGKGEKKVVKVGLSVNGKTEIKDGLKLGEEVLMSKPDSKKDGEKKDSDKKDSDKKTGEKKESEKAGEKYAH